MRWIVAALGAVVGVASVAFTMIQSNGYQVIEVIDGGRIIGQVTMTDVAPVPEKLEITADQEVCGRTEKFSETLVVSAEGGVRNAVVYLREIAQGKAWPLHEELVQSGCQFQPHVLQIPQGADLHVVNNDRISHQVRSHGANLALNVIQPRYVVQLLVPEITTRDFSEKVSEVWCDIHPWMHAHITVQDHPYYAITGEDGSYRLTDIPPGQYELAVWHETLGETTQQVTVNPNGETEVSFEMELGDRPLPPDTRRRSAP